GRTPRWIPEPTPDFPAGSPDPSHPAAPEPAPERDEYPNPSHPATADRAPGRDEYPDPSHPATGDRAPGRDGSPDPSHRASDHGGNWGYPARSHDSGHMAAVTWQRSHDSGTRSRAVPARHQRNPRRNRPPLYLRQALLARGIVIHRPWTA